MISKWPILRTRKEASVSVVLSCLEVTEDRQHQIDSEFFSFQIWIAMSDDEEAQIYKKRYTVKHKLGIRSSGVTYLVSDANSNDEL